MSSPQKEIKSSNHFYQDTQNWGLPTGWFCFPRVVFENISLWPTMVQNTQRHDITRQARIQGAFKSNRSTPQESKRNDKHENHRQTLYITLESIWKYHYISMLLNEKIFLLWLCINMLCWLSTKTFLSFVLFGGHETKRKSSYFQYFLLALSSVITTNMPGNRRGKSHMV